MRRAVLGVVMLGLLFPSRGGAQEGRLQRVRDDVARESDKSRDKCRDDDDDDGNSFFGEVFGPLFGYLLLAPFWLPREGLEGDRVGDAFFRRFPYAGESSRGPLFINSIGNTEDGGDVRSWAVRLSAEGGHDFNGLSRVATHLLFETSSRFGVKASWNGYRERLGGGRYDSLSVGDVTLLYRFAQSEAVQFRAGVGGRFLLDGDRDRGGVNFTYGADIFPVRPFAISLSCDLGSLGSAAVFSARATAGVNWGPLEAYAGYDFLHIGSVSLHGPVLGLRLWF